MKKILCLIITIILMLTCVGCSTVPDAENPSDKSLFVRIETNNMYGYQHHVIYHRDTKVMYIISEKGVATVMLDADGKPLLWEEE